MSKQRTRAYIESEKRTRESYRPVANPALVRIHQETTPRPEYDKILLYQSDARKIGSRTLTIIADTMIELGDDTEQTRIDILGDSLFILNALLAARNVEQPMLALANFAGGFRMSHHDSIHNKIATPLGRAVQALDAASQTVSREIMSWRNHYGPGTNGRETTKYKIMDDIDVIDQRNPQQH